MAVWSHSPRPRRSDPYLARLPPRRARTAALEAGLFTLMLLGGSTSAHGAALYSIDQRFGTIGFSVSELGMLTSSGQFRQFRGQLELDFEKPGRSRIDVVIDTTSVYMPSSDALALLRSPAYFDVGHFETIRFMSTNISQLSPNHYTIAGSLQIRGIMQSETLDATLVDEKVDPKANALVGDFTIKGRLRRSAFGMTAGQDFISDNVDLLIRIRLALKTSANDG